MMDHLDRCETDGLIAPFGGHDRETELSCMWTVMRSLDPIDCGLLLSIDMNRNANVGPNLCQMFFNLFSNYGLLGLTC